MEVVPFQGVASWVPLASFEEEDAPERPSKRAGLVAGRTSQDNSCLDSVDAADQFSICPEAGLLPTLPSETYIPRLSLLCPLPVPFHPFLLRLDLPVRDASIYNLWRCVLRLRSSSKRCCSLHLVYPGTAKTYDQRHRNLCNAGHRSRAGFRSVELILVAGCVSGRFALPALRLLVGLSREFFPLPS